MTNLERARLSNGGLTLGALTPRTGSNNVQRALARVLRLNHRVRAAIFGPKRLALIGKWSGAHFNVFLHRVGADTTTKYVGFECVDGYYEDVDMEAALRPRTLMALELSDETLPTRFRYLFKIRIPPNSGLKSPKFVNTIYVTNQRPKGFWPDRGYNWFSGI